MRRDPLANQKLYISSHAPFWHNGSSLSSRGYNVMLAALPAVAVVIGQYGVSALGVVSFSIATAMLWEIAFNLVSKKPVTVSDGNAAVIGLVFAMLMPATAPWWFVLTGTFIAVIIGKMIFGGLGSNPFDPVALAVAILAVSCGDYLDFDGMYRHFQLDFAATYPLANLKYFGVDAIKDIHLSDLLVGRQAVFESYDLILSLHPGVIEFHNIANVPPQDLFR